MFCMKQCQFQTQNVPFSVTADDMYACKSACVWVRERERKSCVSIVCIGRVWYWFRLTFVSVFLYVTALAALTFITWLNNTGNTTRGKLNVYRYMGTAVDIRSSLLNPVLMEGIILCFSTGVWGSFCVTFICISALMTAVHSCQLCNLLPNCYCEMYHMEDALTFNFLSWGHKVHKLLC